MDLIEDDFAGIDELADLCEWYFLSKSPPDLFLIYYRGRGIWEKHHRKANEVRTNWATLYRLVYNLVTHSVYKAKSNVFMACLVFAFSISESSTTMVLLQRTTINISPLFLAIRFTLF